MQSNFDDILTEIDMNAIIAFNFQIAFKQECGARSSLRRSKLEAVI